MILQQFGKDPNWKAYTGVAVFLVGLAWSVMRWVGRTIKQDVDTGLKGTQRKSLAMQAQADLVPPALIKKALEKGLVTGAQIAKMNPSERQFLFSTLRVQLEATGDYVPSETPRSTTAVRPMSPPRPSQAISPGMTPPRPSQAVRPSMSGAEFGKSEVPTAENLKVHCPNCGALLVLPAFAPFVAHCAQCGFKTAVRQEEGGRLVLTVAPPTLPRRTQSLPEL